MSDLNESNWTNLLERSTLQADHQHYFSKDLKDLGPVTHLKLQIYPDGGISRFRALGKRV